jgi:hypothetical protein
MKLKHVLAVAGLAVALSQSVSVQGAIIGPTASGLVVDNETNMRSLTGIDCLELLAKWDVDENEWTGPSGPFTVNGLPGNSGTWDSGSVGVLAWAVAGGSSFQYYYSDAGPVTSGDWTTIGLSAGASGNTPGLSHISFYGCKPVPEPASILAGLTALGMFALGRKRLA